MYQGNRPDAFDPGGVIKITVWLATRERETWITAGELSLLTLVLLTAQSSLVRALIGLPLLVHVGYKALTSLPMGSVPGRPERGRHRRHYDLRARIVRFLDEVKRMEDFAQQAEVAGLAAANVEAELYAARKRVMAAAAEVAKAGGQSPVPADEALATMRPSHGLGVDAERPGFMVNLKRPTEPGFQARSN